MRAPNHPEVPTTASPQAGALRRLSGMVKGRSIPQSRAERLIAASRFVLAGASLTAIRLDPLEPSRYPVLTYTLLAGYTVYAAAALIWVLLARGTSRRGQLLSHGTDLLFFALINYLTSGPISPFFPYFVFNIACGMLRFATRGTIVTGILTILIFLGTGFDPQGTDDFELNRFVIRTAYLMVVAALLAYLAAYQQRIHRDLSRIAGWSRPPWKSHAELVADTLGEATSIFGAKRGILAYDCFGTRSAHLGEWTGPDFRCSIEPAETADLLLGTSSTTVVRMSGQSRAEDRPTPVMERYAIDSMVATSFHGEYVNGRLLLMDGPAPLLEEVTLAKIAAEVIGSRLEQWHAAEQYRRGAVAEERMRVGRDLHDSILQSLTGVALQLRTIPRLLGRDREAALERIAEAERVIATSQRDLRGFIDQLRPLSGDDERITAGLAERLETMARHFRDHFAADVRTSIPLSIDLLPKAARQEIYSIVQEAVANAARHGAARVIEVSIEVDWPAVRIVVADDGTGFPFHGRYGLLELVRLKRGPVTLKERVASLGGDLVIDSSDKGARLDIRVSVGTPGA